MNFKNENGAVVKEIDLMRLVDGELTDRQRSQILLALENEPGGWRRCALMFIEDQSVRSAVLQGLNDRQVTAHPDPRQIQPSLVPQPVLGKSPRSWEWLLVLAACLMATVLISKWPSQTNSLVTPIENVVDGDQRNHPRNIQPGQDVVPQYAMQTNRDDLHQNTLFVQDNGFWDRSHAIPEDVLQSLRRRGAEVKERRGWMPLRTPDGRQLTVPYQDVQLVPVRSATY